MFYFTKNERKGIFVIVIIILLVLLAPKVYQIITVDKNGDNSEIIEFIEEFEKRIEKKTQTLGNKTDYKKAEAISQNKLLLESFNPNTVKKEKLIEMGLPESLCSTIDNYRNAGGTFNKKEDMKKIYGINDDIYNEMKAFIVIEKKESNKKQNTSEYSNATSTENKQTDNYTYDTKNSIIENLRINLNTTDSVELTKLKGIGQVFGSRIIKYREFLGGFHTESQLLEVYGMDSVRYMNILDNIFIDGEVKKININNAGFKDLVSHPYINRNLANSIIKIREWHGEYKEIEDIKKSDLIDTLIFNRIKHYLTVELQKSN